MNRLEQWVILAEGLWYVTCVIPDTQPLSTEEICKITRAINAVVNVFDALTGDFLGMIYVNKERSDLERVI